MPVVDLDGPAVVKARERAAEEEAGRDVFARAVAACQAAGWSLRAIARHMRITHPFLLDMLQGRRAISWRSVRSLPLEARAVCAQALLDRANDSAKVADAG